MTPSCPRCRELPLQPTSAHGVTALACARCHGLWIDHVSASLVAAGAIAGATAAPADALPCAVCRTTMRAWAARGIVIDRCDEHGLWFDHAELDRVVERARPPEQKPAKRDTSDDTIGWVTEAIAAVVDVFT